MINVDKSNTVEPLLRDHPEKRPPLWRDYLAM